VTDYEAYLASKFTAVAPCGFDPGAIDAPYLKPFQRQLVAWALRRGRSAIFADTGLGKARMEIEWARLVAARADSDVLILAPLAVAAQTKREADAIGVPVTLCRDGADVQRGVNVTNYDRLHRFDASRFAGIALDESSIIKHHDAKTLAQLTEAFARTPFKLCGTATPAPNDYTELGTHAEFLGIRSRMEMLSEYFVHDASDTQTWRLKGHAREAFWQWVATWGAMVKRPSDLGDDDTGYLLPPLNVQHHVVGADHAAAQAQGLLFALDAQTLTERRTARRESMERRVAKCVSLVSGERDQWVIWCDFNAEQDALARALGDEAVSIYGSLDADEKERLHQRWLVGEKRVLISKPSIFGWGLNWQHCARVAFVGLSDSYEAFYQAVRRVWRFGQRRAVDAHVILSEPERPVLANILRKEEDARRMGEELARATSAVVRAAVTGGQPSRATTYNAHGVRLPSWIKGAA
jgi:hypothetical protein